MPNTIDVETQGISDDWSKANGEYETKSRGGLDKAQVLSAMVHLAPLDTPQSDDPCPPHVQTNGPGGSFSFVGQGGSIYCVETDQELTPQEATETAFGKRVMAPPPLVAPRPTASVSTSAAEIMVIKKRKLGMRGGIVMFLALCFLTGAVVMGFGVASMKSRGMSGDDVLAAMTMGIAFGAIGILLIILALKARRTYFVDKSGDRVAEDGSALTFVAMAHHLGDYDDGGGDYSGDDFD